MRFSELLINHRKKHGLKKNEMARFLNWTPMYYGRYENNQLFPNKKNITIFAKILGLSEADLMMFIPQNKK